MVNKVWEQLMVDVVSARDKINGVDCIGPCFNREDRSLLIFTSIYHYQPVNSSLRTVLFIILSWSWRVYLLPNTSQNRHRNGRGFVSHYYVYVASSSFFSIWKMQQRCLQQERFPGRFRFRSRDICLSGKASNPIRSLLLRCLFFFFRLSINFGFSKWEGAVDEDGRKPSVWDTFLHSRKPFSI